MATNYVFSQFSGSYSPISGGTVLFTGSFDDDDPVQVVIPAFTIDGVAQTDMWVDPNGFIGFGGTGWFGGDSYTPLSSSSATLDAAAIIAPFGRDLENADAGSPEISWTTLGNEIVVQYQDVHRYRASTVTEQFSFQIRMNTVSGTIDVVYGDITGTSTATGLPQVGLRGPDNTFATNVNNRTVGTSGPWLASTSGTANNSTMEFNPPVWNPGDVFEWQLAPPCSGQPTLGTAQSTLTNVCPGQFFSLSLVSNPAGTAISYQWQVSSDSINFTDINGATSISYSDTQVATSYYRLVALCNPSGQSDTSSIVAIYQNPVTLCYCQDIGGSCGGRNITNVEIVSTTLNNASSCGTNALGSSQTTFPASGSSTATLNVGSTYTINVTIGGTSIASIWFDWDQSGTFDASEWTQIGTNLPAGVNTVSITVPNTATLGLTAMRIRTRSTGSANGSTDACTYFFSGETEDYFVTIANAVACTDPPVAGTISGPTSICPNLPFRLTLSGQTLGTTIQWQSSNDNISFSDIAGGVNPILNASGFSGTQYYRARINCSDTVYTNVLTINTAAPVAGTVSGPTVANAYTTGVFVLSGFSGDTIRWQFGFTPNGPFSNIGTNNDSLTVSLDVADTVYVRALVLNAGGCKDSTSPWSVIISLPGNDVCDALPIVLGTNGPFNNIAATTQAGEVVPPGLGCQRQDGWCNTSLSFSMWFRFVAPASGRVTIQSPDFDTQLALWQAPACDSLLSSTGAKLLFANDDDTAYASHSGVQYSSFITATCLNPGQTYYVQLDAYSTSTGDTTRIILTDMGALTSAFNGLDSVYCEGSANVIMRPVMSGGVFSGTGITDSTFSPVTAGIGTFQIKYKISACDSTVKTVRVVHKPVVMGTPAITDVPCRGGANGIINVTIDSGSAPYRSFWSNGATTEDLTAAAGVYRDSIADVYGCSVTAGPFTINEPASVVAATIDSTRHVDCFGNANGTVYVSVSGGTPGYTFSWNNGASSEDITSLAGGIYVDTIRDANGCRVILKDTVNAPLAPLSGVLDSVRNIKCHGAATGAIFTTVTGGTAPYSYQWSPAAANAGDVQNLVAGTYFATVTDRNGCTFTAPVGIPVTENPAIVITVDSLSQVRCNGQQNGSIYISVSGGAGSTYTYHWNNGTNTQDLINVSAGNYILGVTDSLGCQTNSSPQNIVQNAALFGLVDSVVMVKCHGQATGGVYVTVTGGNGNYTYLWSNGAVTADLAGVGAGTYTGTITDGNGCTYSIPTGITISEPSSITVTAIVNNEIQNGNSGAINVTVNGGITPYIFSWDNGSVTEDISGLSAGTYQVTVTDRNGCTATRSDTVKLVVTGINEEEVIARCEVFPNPAVSTLWVKLLMQQEGAAEVMLENSEGRIAIAPQVVAGKEVALQLDVNALPAGMYLLRIRANDGVAVRRISIVK